MSEQNNLESSRRADIIEKFGKPRVKEVFIFYDSICRHFGMKKKDATGFDLVVVLKKFNQDDFDYCFNSLLEHRPDFMTTTEIYNLCKKSFKLRTDPPKPLKVEDYNPADMPKKMLDSIKRLKERIMIAKTKQESEVRNASRK